MATTAMRGLQADCGDVLALTLQAAVAKLKLGTRCDGERRNDGEIRRVSLTGKNIRVLVIEDTVEVSTYVKTVLHEFKSANFIVEVVPTMASGLSRLLDPELKKIKLVILDLELPDCSGVEGVRRIMKAMPDVPIVVYSGHASEMAADCIRAGAQEFAGKMDTGPRDLVDKVCTAIIRHEVRGQFKAIDEALANIQRSDAKLQEIEEQLVRKEAV